MRGHGKRGNKGNSVLMDRTGLLNPLRARSASPVLGEGARRAKTATQRRTQFPIEFLNEVIPQ